MANKSTKSEGLRIGQRVDPFCDPPIDMAKMKWVLMEWSEQPTAWGRPEGPYGDREPYFYRRESKEITVTIDDGRRREVYRLIQQVE